MNGDNTVDIFGKQFLSITDDTDMPKILTNLGHRRVCHHCHGRGAVSAEFEMFPGITAVGVMPCPCCFDDCSILGFHDYYCES